MQITFLLGQATGAALLSGTFLFYIIKGFVNPKANWFYVILGSFIAFFVMYYASYPQDLLDNPLMKGLNGLLFIGGIAGAVKYYWRPKKNSASENNIPK